jgi:hypothetical protein
MKSYQRLNAQPSPEAIETIQRVSNKLVFLGLVIINAQLGRSISITVQPTASTRLLQSVYTGQGWEARRMYKSYAAVVDGIKIVWHKPMRAPSASKVIP